MQTGRPPRRSQSPVAATNHALATLQCLERLAPRNLESTKEALGPCTRGGRWSWNAFALLPVLRGTRVVKSRSYCKFGPFPGTVSSRERRSVAPAPELTRDRAHSANSSISQYSLSSQTSSGSAGCAPAQSRHRSILWKDRDQVLEGEGARIVHPKNRDQQMPPSRSGTWHRFGGMWFCRLFPPMPIRPDVQNDIRVL